MIKSIWTKIRQFFDKEKYYKVKDFKWSNFSIVFTEMTDEIALKIVNNIKECGINNFNIVEPKKNKIQKRTNTIDELVTLIIKTVEIDTKEHLEDAEANYSFKYFVDDKFMDSESIKICNVLISNDGSTGNVIYTVGEIFKENENYILECHK